MRFIPSTTPRAISPFARTLTSFCAHQFHGLRLELLAEGSLNRTLGVLSRSVHRIESGPIHHLSDTQ